ncbi:MAG: TatD family deoxyribonuclease [Promethearchaeota archaeon]|nr:MAG: TatD family deoxyribonuclease [Candidatus Lokiarchaeota archaeon]
MFIDIHCHANLYMNLEDILKEAEANNVKKVIAVSMSQKSLKRIIELSAKFDNLYPALGIHPEEVKMNDKIEEQLDSVKDYIRNNQNDIVGIGEIGLDHHFVKENDLYPIQEKIFKSMLELAQQLHLPVNLHTKGAEQEVFDILSSYDIPHVNIHWYSGPEKFLEIGIERGYFFSITPAIFYSPPVKKVVRKINIDHLLLESDGPVKYSGKVGTPAMVKDVLVEIAKMKKCDKKDLEMQIEKNTKKIFPKLF